MITLHHQWTAQQLNQLQQLMGARIIAGRDGNAVLMPPVSSTQRKEERQA